MPPTWEIHWDTSLDLVVAWCAGSWITGFGSDQISWDRDVGPRHRDRRQKAHGSFNDKPRIQMKDIDISNPSMPSQ